MRGRLQQQSALAARGQFGGFVCSSLWPVAGHEGERGRHLTSGTWKAHPAPIVSRGLLSPLSSAESDEAASTPVPSAPGRRGTRGGRGASSSAAWRAGRRGAAGAAAGARALPALSPSRVCRCLCVPPPSPPVSPSLTPSVCSAAGSCRYRYGVGGLGRARKHLFPTWGRWGGSPRRGRAAPRRPHSLTSRRL